MNGIAPSCRDDQRNGITVVRNGRMSRYSDQNFHCFASDGIFASHLLRDRELEMSSNIGAKAEDEEYRLCHLGG